jgi:hypothetical protein
MAILAIFHGKISKSQYESPRKEVKWEKEHPAGAVSHAASFDAGDQLHVADVWESHDAMMAFVEKRLVPGMKKLGITPPDVVVFPIHNLNAYHAIEKYKI